jgi:type IV secretion system protein VirB10
MPDPIPNPQNTPPETVVRNQTTKPPGNLPKNAQAWVIAGLSAVMVAAIALSGNGSKSKQPTQLPRQAGVIDPNASRIAEYRNRLDEETRKLGAEQAALNQAKQAAAGSDPRVAAAMQPGGPPNPYAVQQLPPPDERQSAKKQLEAERERKDYNSLFASNLALSFRKDSRENDTATPGSTPAPPVPGTAPYLYVYPVPPTSPATNVGATQGVAPGAGSPPSSAATRTPQADMREPERAEGQRSHPKPDPELALADGAGYRLLEGTLLETVLTNRLTGSLAGPVNTMLTTNVYSHDREHLLIPQGSRILGEVKPVANFGQQRLAVVFHRIIMPDGYSVSLDQFQGLNQIGETGLRDQVNHHYLEIFGVSIAIGAVAGLSEAGAQYGFTESATDEYRQGFAASLSQSALRILDRFLNVLPTFTIREGHRIKIYLASDLSLPAYDRHKVPNDF